MNHIFAILCAVIIALPAFAGAEETGGNALLDNPTKKMSYALGVDIGENLKSLPVEIDFDVFLRGIKDSSSGTDLLLSPQEVAETKRELGKKVQAERAKVRATQGEKSKKEGEAFLAENKGKEGVVTTESGLQYKILSAGDGPIPTADDKVTVNYRGTLVDGTEFDSSFSRGKPASFPVKGVIKGWTEALQIMPVGSRWQLFIPSDLGYGERGAGAAIGPHATLIFEVELISIDK